MKSLVQFDQENFESFSFVLCFVCLQVAMLYDKHVKPQQLFPLFIFYSMCKAIVRFFHHSAEHSILSHTVTKCGSILYFESLCIHLHLNSQHCSVLQFFRKQKPHKSCFSLMLNITLQYNTWENNHTDHFTGAKRIWTILILSCELQDPLHLNPTFITLRVYRVFGALTQSWLSLWYCITSFSC